MSVEETKTCLVIYKNEHSYKVFISKHSDDFYHGGVFYYTREKDEIDLKLQTFVSNSYEGVYQQCISWLDNTFGHENYSIKQL